MIEAVLWLVINLYHEARGEPLPAQIATVQVVMTRAGWSSENVPGVIQARKQFSWTRNKNKLKQARRIVSSGSLPCEMKPLIRVVYKAINVPFYKRTKWTHYQVPGYSQKWTCWPGGVTTTIFAGSGHIFCGDIDVVKPGETPAYIKKRVKRRVWRKEKESRIGTGGC
jgi:hypothetical protein